MHNNNHIWLGQEALTVLGADAKDVKLKVEIGGK